MEKTVGKRSIQKLPTTKASRRIKNYDYLKYHRPVFDWARRTHGIRTVELETILFLYSENVFNKTKWNEYAMVMPMDRRLLERMIKNGWINAWRVEEDKRQKLYEISLKSKRIVIEIYRKLEGESPLSVFPSRNKAISGTNSRKKFYIIGIKKINANVKAKRLAQRPEDV